MSETRISIKTVGLAHGYCRQSPRESGQTGPSAHRCQTKYYRFQKMIFFKISILAGSRFSMILGQKRPANKKTTYYFRTESVYLVAHTTMFVTIGN